MTILQLYDFTIVQYYNITILQITVLTYPSSYCEDISFEGNTPDSAARISRGDFSHRLEMIAS